MKQKERLEQPMIKDATFTSVWDGGTEITTNCKVNVDTREIFDIEQATNIDVGSLNSLEEEYLFFLTSWLIVGIN